LKITHCEQCGANTPEGFSICPLCMRASGADESKIKAAAELLDIATVFNIGHTDASRRNAIKSILRIKERLEESGHEEKA
jgi:hypothetical protein